MPGTCRGRSSADAYRSCRAGRLLLVTRLVIVDRGRPELFEQLANRFARERSVRVMFDRRSGADTPSSIERRHEGDSTVDLSSRGYIVVDTPD
jgi:hypothetical protein